VIVLLTLPLNAEATPKENPEEVMSGNPNKHKMNTNGMMRYVFNILPLLSKTINKTTFTPYFIGFIDLLQWLRFNTRHVLFQHFKVGIKNFQLAEYGNLTQKREDLIEQT